MNDPLNIEPPKEKFLSPERRAELNQTKALLEKRKITLGCPIEDDQKKRDEVARLNRQELLRLIAEHDLFISRSEFDNWRPTARESGDIVGVKEGLTIIATDGNLAYFLPSDDFDVFFGHIQMFSGEVRTLYAMPKEGLIKDKANKPKKEKRHVRDALALLEQLKQQAGA